MNTADLERKKCRKKHYSEVCQHLEACKSTKTCKKQHPKNCKKYNTERGCRFGSECAYYHKRDQDSSKPCECQTKIDILEKIVTEMAHKIVNHENTLDNMKMLLSEQSELKKKVNLLEVVVQKMFLEKIQLEAKPKNKKITIVDKEIIEEAIEEETDCKRKQKITDREDGTDVKIN